MENALRPACGPHSNVIASPQGSMEGHSRKFDQFDSGCKERKV